MNIKRTKRDSAFLEYKTFSGKDSYVEVTDWTNGEGCDIMFGENTIVSLHHDEIDAFLAVYHASKVSDK